MADSQTPRGDPTLERRLDDLEIERDGLRVSLAAALERESVLVRITQRINQQPLDVDGTLVAIAEAARGLTGGDAARVWLRDGDVVVPGPGAVGSGPAEFMHVQDSHTVAIASSRLPVPTAVREGRTIAVDDLLDCVPDSDRERFTRLGVRSVMVAPLRSGASVTGALSVVRNVVRPFIAAELSTLAAFADQAAPR